MRRHPFFGIVVPDADDGAPRNSLPGAYFDGWRTARRSFFGQVAALAAGAAALLIGRNSRGQNLQLQGAATLPGATTGQVMPNETRYTTQALGEEGGGYQPPVRPSLPPPGTVTTYAIGEEGGSYRRPPYSTAPPPATVTTYAMGEEGGVYRPRRYFYRRPPNYYRRY